MIEQYIQFLNRLSSIELPEIDDLITESYSGLIEDCKALISQKLNSSDFNAVAAISIALCDAETQEGLIKNDEKKNGSLTLEDILFIDVGEEIKRLDSHEAKQLVLMAFEPHEENIKLTRSEIRFVAKEIAIENGMYGEWEQQKPGVGENYETNFDKAIGIAITTMLSMQDSPIEYVDLGKTKNRQIQISEFVRKKAISQATSETNGRGNYGQTN